MLVPGEGAFENMFSLSTNRISIWDEGKHKQPIYRSIDFPRVEITVDHLLGNACMLHPKLLVVPPHKYVQSSHL